MAKLKIFLLFSNVMKRCRLSSVVGDELDMEPIPGLLNKPKPFRAVAKESVGDQNQAAKKKAM